MRDPKYPQKLRSSLIATKGRFLLFLYCAWFSSMEHQIESWEIGKIHCQIAKSRQIMACALPSRISTSAVPGVDVDFRRQCPGSGRYLGGKREMARCFFHEKSGFVQSSARTYITCRGHFYSQNRLFSILRGSAKVEIMLQLSLIFFAYTHILSPCSTLFALSI